MSENQRWRGSAKADDEYQEFVELPADHAQHRDVFELVEAIGRPDDEGDDELLIDSGQSTIRLWWD